MARTRGSTCTTDRWAERDCPSRRSATAPGGSAGRCGSAPPRTSRCGRWPGPSSWASTSSTPPGGTARANASSAGSCATIPATRSTWRPRYRRRTSSGRRPRASTRTRRSRARTSGPAWRPACAPAGWRSSTSCSSTSGVTTGSAAATGWTRSTRCPACAEHGVGVIVRVALDEGGLTGRIRAGASFPKGDFRNGYFGGDRAARVEQHVDALAADLGVPLEQVPGIALRYVLSAPEVSTVIPGMRTVRNVERNAAVSDGRTLTGEQLATLAEHVWERNFYERE